MKRWLTFTKQNGFSLLEIMVAVAIIGMLAAVVMFSMQDVRKRSAVADAQADLLVIRQAMQMRRNHTGLHINGKPDLCSYESGDSEVAISSSDLVEVSELSGWRGPYLEVADSIDPWGTTYYFDPDYQCRPEVLGCDGRSDSISTRASVVIVSCGPDKRAISAGSASCAYNEDNVVLWLCSNQD